MITARATLRTTTVPTIKPPINPSGATRIPVAWFVDLVCDRSKIVKSGSYSNNELKYGILILDQLKKKEIVNQ
jgi:hypothetical protein